MDRRPDSWARPLCIYVYAVVLVVGGRSVTWGQAAPRPSSSGAATSAKSAAQERFRAAQQLAGEGAVDKALEAVREDLKIEPRSVEGWNLLGIIYDQQRDYVQALAAFNRALEINPRSTETHNNLGISYFTQRKLDLATAEFQRSLRLNPRDRTANYNMGMVELAEGNAKEAITYLSRVRPPDDGTSLNLTQAYLGAHETAEGLKLAQTLSDQAPNDVRVHFSLGVILAAQKQYAAAVHELELADALKPGTPEILHNLGQAYLRDKKPEKAQQVLERAVSLQPDSSDTLYLLGQAYNDQHKILQGLEVLLRAHKLAPENTDVIFLMGRLSMQQSYYEDAIQLLEQGVKIAPKRADLRAALGESYFTAGKVDKAKEEFQTLLALEPSARSYAFMGLCYRHLGKFDEAKKYFEEGLKKDPQNPACLFNLGYIANKQGDQTGAEKLLERAIQAAPDYDDALFELASVKMSQRKFSEAVPLLRRCTKLALHPAEAYYKLATAERTLHQTQAAERDMKIFETLARDPKPGPYPFQHLFDYLSQRTALPEKSQAELDLAELQQEAKRHSENPRNLYLLAEAYLKLGQADEARKVVEQLDQLSGGDARTMLGTGVLLARYRLYSEAIRHFQAALTADPTSDDARYNLATTYFQMRDYPHALEMMQKVSPQAQDDAYLSLLGDIDTHLGRTAEAIHIFEQATQGNPDNDLNYLSLGLAQLGAGDAGAARQALSRGLVRIPDSGHILWGMGVLSVFEGENAKAEAYFKRAVELLPEWQGGYSALGTFYYQTGQVDKARETLDRYQKLFPHGMLNVSRIQQTLQAAALKPQPPQTLSSEGRHQFLGIALALADETP
ncbi:MAG TPA: tetratricopeptide repeat protein [Terriglobia bacterium]|nr:tetratricopeptide repeat protein [Terriglobia bacterium]